MSVVVSLFLVHHVAGVRVYSAVMIFGTGVVYFVVRGTHLIMILTRTHLTTPQIFPTTHHSPIHFHMINITHVNIVGVLTKDLSVKPETRFSMNSFLVTLNTFKMTKPHIIHQTSHNNYLVVSTVEVHTSALIVKQGIHFLVTIMTIRIITNLHSTK